MKSRGFTLIELIVVIAIVGILTAFALPTFRDWSINVEYRTAARDAAGALRLARQMAISKNLEHNVEFDIEGSRFRIKEVSDAWSKFSKSAKMAANTDCSVTTGTKTIQFNPNGSSQAQYICILDAAGNMKYRTGVPRATTGRVVVQKRKGSTWE